MIVEWTSGNEIEVTATARARRSDPSEVRVEVVEHAEGVTILRGLPHAAWAARELPRSGLRRTPE